jgi:signal transduction histidine kinase
VAPTLTHVLALLQRGRELVDRALAEALETPARVGRIAQVIASLWPDSPVHACLLWLDDGPHACVLDPANRSPGSWLSTLHQELARPNGSVDLPAVAASALLKSLQIPDHHLVTEDVVWEGRWLGLLSLAVPKGAPAEGLPAAHAVLRACCDQLALRLHLEGLHQERGGRQAEAASLRHLANLGELAGPLAHEFNNFLNSLLLHLTLLEQDLPEGLRPELADIRRQGRRTAETIRQWQQLRRADPDPPPASDLNRVVRETAEALSCDPTEPGRPLLHVVEKAAACPPPPGSVPLHLELAADLPPVLGHRLNLIRLCTFLLSNAARAAGSADQVVLRTGREGDRVLLRVEDPGPNLGPSDLTELFEPRPSARPGTVGLELAACKTLARRLKGTIRGENRAEGGLAVTVELPAVLA